MADVEDGLGFQWRRWRGYEDAEVRVAKGLDDGDDLLDRHTGRDRLQRGRPPAVAALGAALAQPPEEDLGDGSLALVQPVEYLVGVAGERHLEAADHLVVGDCEHDLPRVRGQVAQRGSGADGARPEAHQGVLHQGHLVRACIHVVERAVDQRRVDPAIEDQCRRFDRLAALVASQARGEELAVVERLG